MTTAFIFILAIITSTGELQLNSNQVDACPDQAATTKLLNETPEVKDWSVQCIPILVPKKVGA